MILLVIPLEAVMDLRPLQLSPLIAGCIGMVKAGTLSGTFYIQAIVMFVAALAMAYWPSVAHSIFGLTSAGCFFSGAEVLSAKEAATTGRVGTRR